MLGGMGRGRRLGWTLACLTAGWVAAGCRDGKNEGGAVAAEMLEPAADGELSERRDALLETRRALALRRAELDEKRQALEATGGDTALIERQVTELVLKEREVEKEALDLADELLRRVKAQQSQLAIVAGKLSGDTKMTVRESSIASREGERARREKELAARESALAARQVKAASEWQEKCASSGTILSMPAAPAGSKYRKRDVERNLSKASGAMRKRGILSSDLPASLRSLSRAAEKAMVEGDYGQAYFAAEQLAKGVETLKVDRTFVKLKFERAKQVVTGDLSDRDAELLTKITADFGEGRYAAANRRLNELMSR